MTLIGSLGMIMTIVSLIIAFREPPEPDPRLSEFLSELQRTGYGPVAIAVQSACFRGEFDHHQWGIHDDPAEGVALVLGGRLVVAGEFRQLLLPVRLSRGDLVLRRVELG